MADLRGMLDRLDALKALGGTSTAEMGEIHHTEADIRRIVAILHEVCNAVLDNPHAPNPERAGALRPRFEEVCLHPLR